MYADQLEAQSKRSVKERLNGNFAAAAGGGRRIITGKRQREDDGKWEHDLFLDNIAPGSDRKKIGTKDLRFKLQRKSTIEKANQNVRESSFGASRDLREKLSGGPSYSLPSETKTLPVRPNPALEANKPTRKSVIAPIPNIRTNASNSTTTKKALEKKADSVENFLRSLGLEKYSITFQAEEVDMTALLHMKDEDLKAIGIPMGPRKKILLGLESKSNE